MMRGDAELEQLLREVDRACMRALRGDRLSPQSEQSSEALTNVGLAQALDGESMDIDALREAWRAMPQDVKQQLFAMAKHLWQTREVNISYFIATAYMLMRGGMPMLPALRQAAVRLNIPRRSIHDAPPGLSRMQVTQYHRRQQQRGRRPGQNPQLRSRLQREAEWQDAPPPPSPPAPSPPQSQPPANQQLIPPWELVTRRVTSPADSGSHAGYRGVGPQHRRWAKEVYDRQLAAVNQERAAAGLPPLPAQRLSVGHVNPLAFTPPGGTVPVRPQIKKVNQADANAIKDAAAARRQAGLFVRKVQK